MKELDLLFERFLARGFEELDDGRLDLLETLLKAPDQDLLEFLGGAAEPDDQDLAHFVRWLRTRIGSAAEAPAKRPGRE